MRTPAVAVTRPVTASAPAAVTSDVFAVTPRTEVPARFFKVTSCVVPKPISTPPLTVEAKVLSAVAASALGVASAVTDERSVE